MKHQDQINAIIMEIKPRKLTNLCKGFDKKMIYGYLKKIRNTDVIQYGFGVKQRNNDLKLDEKQPESSDISSSSENQHSDAGREER